MLKKDVDLSIIPSNPTSCGVDGSYAIERLLYTDLVAVAGVAIEGLTPPSEKRYWPIPHHLSEVITIPHNDSTVLVARAIMMCMELELAGRAPHDVVLFDGSLTTPIIYLNQALNRINEVPKELSELLTRNLEQALVSYEKILLSQRTDKIFAGIPKYTTRREISRDVLDLQGYEDRGLLTFILEAGEFVGSVQMQKSTQPWHINIKSVKSNNLQDLVRAIINGLNELQVIYYRPFSHSPALRVEIAKSVVANDNRLANLFESLRLQCGTPNIMEPYPLYLADRMVKHLGTALPAIRKTTTQQMSTEWEDKLGNMFLAMHGYRTDWGK